MSKLCLSVSAGTTIIKHDHESSQTLIDIAQVGGYHSTVVYPVPTPQLKALAALSTSCQQQLLFVCKQFPLWSYDGGEMMYGWWVNVDGQKMNSWGGVATSGTGCKCAETQSR